MATASITSKKFKEPGSDEIMDYLHTDLDDIIFQGRNKAYGAYYLRKHYPAVLTKANILAVFLFLAGINLPKIVNLVKGNLPQEEILFETEVTLTEPPPLDEKTAPPPPPPPPVFEPQMRRPTIAFVAPKVKKDEEVIEEVAPPDVEELRNVDISTQTREGKEDGIAEGIFEEEDNADAPPPPQAELEMEVKKERPPFRVVEQMPSYPDGEAALLKFLYDNIQFPAVARDNGIKGLVIVQFVVEKDGSITNIEIMRDIGGGCGLEAVRVVKMMPKWNPGKQRGHPVRVEFTLPVKFILK